MERARRAPAAGAGTADHLPVGEPRSSAVPRQRTDLEQHLEELEDQFRYMGTSHPQYTETALQLSELRAKLKDLG